MFCKNYLDIRRKMNNSHNIIKKYYSVISNKPYLKRFKWSLDKLVL